MARLRKHSLAWWKRQRRLRDAVRAAVAAAATFSPPSLSKASKRELDDVLRDLGGEG